MALVPTVGTRASLCRGPEAGYLPTLLLSHGLCKGQMRYQQKPDPKRSKQGACYFPQHYRLEAGRRRF